MKIVFSNGSVINVPETLDTQGVRGQSAENIEFFTILDEIEENEEIE